MNLLEQAKETAEVLETFVSEYHDMEGDFYLSTITRLIAQHWRLSSAIKAHKEDEETEEESLKRRIKWAKESQDNYAEMADGLKAELEQLGEEK